MNLKLAQLIKRKTANGFFALRETVPLGKLYVVDTDMIKDWHSIHLPTQTPHVDRCVWVWSDTTQNFTPYPTELLRVVEDNEIVTIGPIDEAVGNPQN